MTDDTTPLSAQPQDPSPHEWVAATRALATRGRTASAEAELIAITAHADRAATRVALVSVSPKNRVRLVNALLNREVIPPDGTPDVPVFAAAGPARLEVRSGGGWHDRPDGAGRWWHEGEPPALAFRLLVDAPELAAPGIELVSVPAPEPDDAESGSTGSASTGSASTESAGTGSAGTGSGSPAGQAAPGADRWAALASADAVIMVVQAAAAMTRTETILLGELLRRGMPAGHALVAVARLDLVEEGERGPVLNHVKDRAVSVSPAVAVLPARPEADGEPGVAQAVRDWIASAVLPDAGPARVRQLAEQLVACLRQVDASAAAAVSEAEQEQARWDERARATEAALSDEMRGFDHVREDVRGRRNAALAEFLKDREQFAARLSAELLHQLDANADPADWWARELPYQLDARLPALSQQVAMALQQRLSTDAQAVAAELDSRFGVRPRQLTGLAVPEPRTTAPPGPGLKSLQGRRLLYRAGPPGAALLAVLVIPGIGPIAALGASLVGIGLAEVKLRGLAEEQRKEIRTRLPALLDNLLNTYGDEVSKAVDQVYQQHEEEVGRLREQWQASAEPPPARPADKLRPWVTLRADCAALIDKIRAEAGTGADSSADIEVEA